MGRPDNRYNRRAISIAAPGRLGGTVEERHLGYVPDWYLNRIGKHYLPDLIHRTQGEVKCRGRIDALDEFILAWLPSPMKAPRQPRRPTFEVIKVPPTRMSEQQGSPSTDAAWLTNETLTLIRRHVAPVAPVGPIDLSTEPHPIRGERSIRVHDRTTGDVLGALHQRYLFLRDERTRSAVLHALKRESVEVNEPTSRHPAAEDPAWLGVIPNLWTFWHDGPLSMRARATETERRYLSEFRSVAIYDFEARRLRVVDLPLVTPACIYAARIGLEVDRVEVPADRWDELVPGTTLSHRSDPLRSDAWLSPALPAPEPVVLPKFRTGTVARLLEETVAWSRRAGSIQEPPQAFVCNETSVQVRKQLFPGYTLHQDVGRCRLCGASEALSMSVPGCRDALFYCHWCLTFASRGTKGTMEQTATAVRHLADIEFDGVPMLESQLDTIHLNPNERASADFVDQAMLARFAISRRSHPWTHVLADAGLAARGVRRTRGTVIRARDGHMCRSLRERAVCDFLHQFEIEHTVEPLYPADPTLNSNGRSRADWLLADGTFVEMWGMPNDPVYAAKMERKRELAQRSNLRLIEITDKDLPELYRVFEHWLPEGAQAETRWRWAPSLITQRGDEELDRDPHPTHEEKRASRVVRARKAVELRLRGFSRAEVAAELQVEVDTAKGLLRDGYFYADPARNPDRLKRALQARDHVEAGGSKRSFRERFGLTQLQVTDAWRDANVVEELSSSELLPEPIATGLRRHS